MRSSTLLCLTAVAVAALLPTAAAVQARFVTDVKATARRGEQILSAAAIVNARIVRLTAAVQARIVTDVNTTPRRGEPGLKPNALCASTDDPVQCLALVDLYTATDGDKWTNNTGWLSGSSYCDWNWGSCGSTKCGVTCDSSGNVTML